MERLLRFTGTIILTILIMVLIDKTPLVNFLAIWTLTSLISMIFDPKDPPKKSKNKEKDNDEDDDDDGDYVPVNPVYGRM